MFEFDITTWDWYQLLIGIAALASGAGIFSGNVAARTVGVIVAAIAAIANFAWLPHYPLWSIVIIAICVTIIWALTAHGRDITMRHSIPTSGSWPRTAAMPGANAFTEPDSAGTTNVRPWHHGETDRTCAQHGGTRR